MPAGYTVISREFVNANIDIKDNIRLIDMASGTYFVILLFLDIKLAPSIIFSDFF